VTATTATSTGTAPVALDVAGLAKTYASHGRSVEAVRDLTFQIRRGELVCIVGPSGAGKTTLLRCIAGLLEVSGGQIRLDDTPVTGPPPGMAVVFQEYGRSLFPWLTVRRNVELPLKEKGLARAARAAKVDAALEAVGLRDSADAHPWQLSGGMQQRVAIARAVAYEPSVLLMDEPFAAVDAQTRADLEDLVLSIRHEYGVTVLFVTHDIDESVYMGDRVVILTPRPSRVQEVLEVDLPRPRDQVETKELPEFAHLRAHVYRAIKGGREADEQVAAGSGAEQAA
jgi:NitT/TauT family transport system ATP-binding protein